MRHKNITPYISIVFANRNDQYTSDQVERIKAFIKFYSYCDQKYPDLFEFVICDWNPPQKMKSLKEQYDWGQLSRVKHLTVSSEIHSKLCPDNSRPILDYIGRNACIRRASAPFILVINQDIFLSSSILEFLAKRSLSEKHFYRADRCDFEFDYEKGFSGWKNFDDYAKKNVINKHIRPSFPLLDMSIPVNSETFEKIFTRARLFERKSNGIFYTDSYRHLMPFIKFSHKILTLLKLHNFTCQNLSLHTNASGDFLLAPKKAFFDIHGFVETSEFYMHLDAYICVQLFVAGYNQAILSFPHTVFHSNHSRSVREGRPESMNDKQHAKLLGHFCMKKNAPNMNPDSWGLESLNLSAPCAGEDEPRD